MHVSVTALGAPSERTKSAANDIVNYLEGGVGVRSKAGSAAEPPQLGQGSAPGAYYSDSPEQAGRWRGAGAADLGDAVDAETFKRVLLGQHPVTGQQLVTAAGSSARAKHHPRGLQPGDPDELVNLKVAAEAIGVDVSYLRRVARESATSRSPAHPPPVTSTRTSLDAHKVGNAWMVRRSEVERFIQTRNQPQVVMGYDPNILRPKVALNCLGNRRRGDATSMRRRLRGRRRSWSVLPRRPCPLRRPPIGPHACWRHDRRFISTLD